LGLAQVSWATARVGVHRLSPFVFDISVFFHSLFTCHWISFVFLLYDQRICTHSIDPSLADGMFPGLGLALVTGVDLSKILGGQTKIYGGQKVVKSDKCMAFLNYWGARAWAAPKVCAYGSGTRCCPRRGAWGVHEAEISFQISALVGV